MITTQEAEAIKELVPAFEELTGITVNWDSLEQNSEIDKLNVEFRSGAGSIDAFQVDFMLLPEWAGERLPRAARHLPLGSGAH